VHVTSLYPQSLSGANTKDSRWQRFARHGALKGNVSMTEALMVVDVQNEFSAGGKRAVPNHSAALVAIQRQVDRARQEGRPIAWVRHHNKPDEAPAFVPGSWGAEFSPGLEPQTGFGPEALFEKEVFGAFTGTMVEEWLRVNRVQSVLIIGFFAHMCLSTSAREALSRGFHVLLDPEATGACDIENELLGRQNADEVRRSALLQLANMGAVLTYSVALAGTEREI
jgi:nicotinamidase-related amidase